MRDQIRVYTLVEGYVRLADSYLESLPSQTTAFGEQRRCRALTRQGTPCRREPLPGREYCPSHKHLEETEHWTHVPATSADRALARVA